MNVRLHLLYTVVIKEQSSIKSNMDAIVYFTLLLTSSMAPTHAERSPETLKTALKWGSTQVP